MKRKNLFYNKWVFVCFIFIVEVLLACTFVPMATSAPVQKPMGTLVIALAGFGNETFFPTEITGPEATLMSCVWESLIHRKRDSRELVPGLAEKWTVSDDGRTYTFYLRKGVQFHDAWGEFTAEDVKWNIELMMRPGSKAHRAPDFRANLDSVKIVNPYQVVINSKKPWVELPNIVATMTPSLPIISKKYVETVGEKEATRRPIGTGPYKLVERKVGEYLKFEALEKHWSQVPYFKTLILRLVPEEATRISMLRTGEADIAEMSLAFKEEVEKAGLKVLQNESAGYSQIWLAGQVLPTREGYDSTLPWVGDYSNSVSQERAKKVRMALNLAIDRKAIIDAIFKGMGEPSLVPGADKSWWPPDLKPYPYDPRLAKQVLTEAGYPNGFEMTIKLVAREGRPEGPVYGEAVAMMWEKHLGLKVKREMAEYPVVRAQFSARKCPWAMTGDWSYWDEMYMPLAGGGTTTSTLLITGTESPKLDKLVAASSSELDKDKRHKINQDIIRWWYDGYHSVPICIRSQVWGAGKKVGQWYLVPGSPHPHNFEYITPAK